MEAVLHYPPQQLVDRAREGIVTHDATIPAQRQRMIRVVQWAILRDSRPKATAPEGQLLRFQRHRAAPILPPRTPTGGHAA